MEVLEDFPEDYLMLKNEEGIIKKGFIKEFEVYDG